MTPSDSGEEHDNAEDGDYFSSRETESNLPGKSTKNINKSSYSSAIANSEDEEEDDDEYDEQGASSSSKRKKTGTSRLPALPKGNQRRKSSSAGTSNPKRRKRVVEDEEEAEERRRKAASTGQVSSSCIPEESLSGNILTVVSRFLSVLRQRIKDSCESERPIVQSDSQALY